MNTRKPDLASALEYCLITAHSDCSDAAVDPAGLLVGLSGGLDSSVLLLLAKQFSVSANRPLRALHIDHQLHPDSARWRDHCARLCLAHGIEFESVSVQLGEAWRANLEEAARDARYAAFAKQLRVGDCLLTAHHADDQAETLLLQLLRGAGIKGMAAMPAVRRFATGLHLRPLLPFARSELRDYAVASQLEWIDDPANEDYRFDRNLIRQQIMPLLLQRWPGAVQNICRSARHCASAARLLNDSAAQDLADFASGQTLPLARLRTLDSDHLSNVLRCWIEARGFRLPSTSQLAQIERSLVAARNDSAGDVQWASGQMRCYDNQLFLGARGELSDAPGFDHYWENCQQPFYVPELQQMLSPDWLPVNRVPGAVRAHSRLGGERFYPVGHNRQRKQLKKWFQEQRIPPWQRNRVIVFSQAGQVIGIYGPV